MTSPPPLDPDEEIRRMARKPAKKPQGWNAVFALTIVFYGGIAAVAWLKKYWW